MGYTNTDIQAASDILLPRAKSGDISVMRSVELKALFDQLKTLPPEQRGSFGQEVNLLRTELSTALGEKTQKKDTRTPIDVTAPWDINDAVRPSVFAAQQGSAHPLMTELQTILDIYYRMGFNVVESRQIDDDYHMFESLNFPADHPARDDYDTFMTDEGFIAPAHTSTMQNRALIQYKDNLQKGEPIAAIIPGRVFRNEDIDVTHEHTFYQIEGVYVGKGINVGNLVAVLRTFMSEYFGKELKAKIQPFYFPFTEPSFEFAIERPEALRKGNTEADMWLELLGCGMIHPNVLKAAGIDSNEYTGFAWGGGLERLVLMKYGIEDIRHFESAKLDFLRQF
jgi:phenylalanyl-tRNA synthetase alpha chain